MKKKSKKLNKIQKSYKLRPSFILRKNREEHKHRKFKTQKHLSIIFKKNKKITSDPPQHKIKHK